MKTFTMLFKGDIMSMLIAVDTRGCQPSEDPALPESGVYEMTQEHLLAVLEKDREALKETQKELQVVGAEPESISFTNEELVKLYDEEGLPDCACQGWLVGRRPEYPIDAVVVR